MEKFRNLEKNGYFFLFLCSSHPIINYITLNFNDQLFSYYRAIYYFLVIFLGSLIILYVFDFITKRKKTLLIFYSIALFLLLSLNYFLFYKIILSSVYFISDLILKEKLIFYLFIAFYALLIFISYKLVYLKNFRIVFYFVILTLIFLDIFLFIPRYYIYLKTPKLIDFEMSPKANQNIITTNKSPNVYLIIPDAMPSPNRIQSMLYQDYEYKKIKKLKNLGFTFIENAKSNGMDTQTAIPHFFSMNYFYKKSKVLTDNNLTELGTILKGHNPVISEFRKRNYKYIKVDGPYPNFNCSNIIEDRCISDYSITNNQDRLFFKRTYIHLIFHKLEKITSTRKILRYFNLNLTLSTDANHFHWTDNIIEHNKFKSILPKISESPYFYHLHIAFPHPPLRFDDNCNKFSIFQHDIYEKNFEIWSNNFLKQIQCAEKKIINFAKKIIEHDKNALIVIQSDHGFGQNFNSRDRSKKPKLSDDEFENVFGIFSIFKLPNKCINFNTKNYSPVNTFRIIFACLDNKEPVLLPHRMFANHDYLYELRRNELGKYEITDF